MPKKLDPIVAVAEVRAAGVEPLDDYPGTMKPWRCRCLKCGREVTPTLGSIRSGRSGCKYCAGNSPVEPKVAVAEMRAAGLEPLEDFESTKAPWQCRCLKCGKGVTPTLGSIRSRQGGCIYCSYKLRGEKQRENPDVAVAEMRAAGVEALDDYPGTMKPWRCRCLKCGKEVTPTLGSIRSGNGGCRYCRGNVVAEKLRGDPEVAVAEMRAAGLEPLEDFGSTKAPWRCRCLKCGKEVTPTLGSIRSGNGGCRYCAGLFIDAEEAVIEMNAAGLDPLQDYPGSSVPWRCRCLTCRKEVTPRHRDIRNGHGGCKYCALGGIDWDAPALVYLIHHEEFGSHKVGITGSGSRADRLKGFSALGWEIHKTLELPTGEDAHEVEQEVLNSYREQNFCPYLTPDLMKSMGGHSETIDAEAVSLLDLWRQIEEVAEEINRGLQ